MKRRAIYILLGVFLAGGGRASIAAGEEASHADPPALSVSGMGWWKNWKLRRTLKLLESEDQPLTSIDAAFVEDAVVILQSFLERDGFLNPSGEVVVRKEGSEIGDFKWESGDVPEVPRDLEADAVLFKLEPGVRFRFKTIEFEGLSALRASDARGFFVDEGFVLSGASTRKFTPSVLNRGVGNLREQLARMGYADARVEVASQQRDEQRGTVDVVIDVEEGPLYQVGEVQPPRDLPEDLANEIVRRCSETSGAACSRVWQQDFSQALRAVAFSKGYANAEASVEKTAEEKNGGHVSVSFSATLKAGPKVHVGKVDFEGDEHTADSVLIRAIDVHPGDVFVRREVNRDRLKLGGLGIFSSVRAEIQPEEPDLWDVTYKLRPGKRLEASVLAGYGSYEQLRGGLEVFHANLFGRAHRGRLQLIQSMKSSSGDYLYSVPQIFGTLTDASVRVFGLSREEVSFDRREFGSSVGLRRHVDFLGADAAVRYQFESVTADVTDENLADEAPTDSRVASLTFDLTRDRRDNPLTPHTGHFLALTLESAATAIGGQVDYQRLELRAAWHKRLGRESFLHLGFRHGLLASFGDARDDIPLAKRFFPGGENTIRGYREGRAAPRNADGLVIGAEESTIINVELEQALTRDFSAVVFVDAGLTGAKLGDWPGDQWRVSAGLGLRYNTIIGPARLEYGHNIVKQTGDQVGELHFALGFPF